MDLRQIHKQVGLHVMSLFCACLLATAAQQDSAPPLSASFAGATIVDLLGKVEVQLPGQGLSVAARGQVLPPDSEINTDDGQILLRLEDGSEVLVHPHTHLVLKQPTASNWQRLQLVLGRIRAEIQKRVSGAPPFQVGTPSAVISVRGTRFYVDVDKHKTTEVDVEEGEVQLESVKGVGTPVVIPAGSSSRVGENSAPEPTQPTSKLQHQSGKSSSGNGGDGGHASSGQGNTMRHTHSTSPSKGVGKHWMDKNNAQDPR